MGIFDFLKTKKISTQNLSPIISSSRDCDINKTVLVTELLKIPRSQRDDVWNAAFYDNIATASFRSATPALCTGPDGFTYFILRTPEGNESFEPFCIKNMTEDFLMNNGWGVVFNPAADLSAEWVFNYGSIVNYNLNKEFWSEPQEEAMANIAFEKNVGVLQKSEKVMIAQPSIDYLPNATRQAIKIFLQSKGIKTPKVMMLTAMADQKIIRKLAFNIHPEDYPLVSKLDFLMQQLGWFLPNNYLLIPLQKHSELACGFNEL